MKHTTNRLMALMFTGIIGFAHSLAGQPRIIVPSPELDNPAITWSGETNGVTTGMLVGSESPFNVWIFLQLTKANTTADDVDPKRNHRIRGTHFMATNGFCGPIELKDASGKIVPTTKDDVNNLDAYPASFSLSSVRHAFESQYSIYSGPGFPPIPVRNGAMPGFSLTNYFNIEKPGEYRLTVWPKIYRRSLTNSDLCERIVAMSVSVVFTNKPAR